MMIASIHAYTSYGRLLSKSLLVLTTLVVLFAGSTPQVIAAPTSACPAGVTVRKEIRQLTASEWTNYVNAVKKLNSTGRYDQLVKVHIDQATSVRGNALYFPFQRQYLRAFEQALQQIDPTITLPYWDWAIDAQDPAASPVFGDPYMGGNGTGAGGVVSNGQFKNWQVVYPSRHQLMRQFSPGTHIGAFYSNTKINHILATAYTYDVLRRELESAAGVVHNGIGGDMRTIASPNDPIYWVHAAYMDKLWATWQAASPTNARQIDGLLGDGKTKITANTPIPGYAPVRVADVFSPEALCYRYQ